MWSSTAGLDSESSSANAGRHEFKETPDISYLMKRQARLARWSNFALQMPAIFTAFLLVAGSTKNLLKTSWTPSPATGSEWTPEEVALNAKTKEET